MKTIYLLRHGQTAWNVERRMQGRLDSPLTRSGTDQAHIHGQLLKSFGPIERMFVSPSGRTRETAYIVNSYVRSQIEYVDALLERDVGHWSGLTVDEIEEAFPQGWRARLEDPYYHRPPEGENLADMAERCREFIDALFDDDSGTIALVTHQVMSRVILGRLLDLEPEETLRVLHPNDAVYELRLDRGRADVSHFRMGDGPFGGLLRQGDDETIPRFKKPNEDPDR